MSFGTVLRAHHIALRQRRCFSMLVGARALVQGKAGNELWHFVWAQYSVFW